MSFPDLPSIRPKSLSTFIPRTDDFPPWPLRLLPGQPLALPAVDIAATAVCVQVPLKAFGNVDAPCSATGPVRLLGERGSRLPGPCAGATDEQRGVGPFPVQPRFHLPEETGIRFHPRIRSPLGEYHRLADSGKIGNADKRPFRQRPDIDKDRPWVLGQLLPSQFGCQINDLKLRHVGHCHPPNRRQESPPRMGVPVRGDSPIPADWTSRNIVEESPRIAPERTANH